VFQSAYRFLRQVVRLELRRLLAVSHPRLQALALQTRKAAQTQLHLLVCLTHLVCLAGWSQLAPPELALVELHLGVWRARQRAHDGQAPLAQTSCRFYLKDASETNPGFITTIVLTDNGAGKGLHGCPFLYEMRVEDRKSSRLGK
jgi:hypothetical protein